MQYQWHQIRIVMAEMIHFMRQMQAYCQLEVIECSWKNLVEFIQRKEGDLDALIDAHRSYLDRMVNKVLLLSPKAGREVRQIIHTRASNSSVIGKPAEPSSRIVHDNLTIQRSNREYQHP